MLDHSLIPLAFVGGTAILANACAILQNGAAVAATILQETRCTRTLMGLHLQRDSGARV